MSAEDNKAIVGRWFTEFWGRDYNSDVIDELAAPDIRFEYSLHAPLRGRAAVRDFATKFRAAFPDLAFGGTADLIAEGDYVVGQWIGGGTHTGDPMTDLPLGGLPEAQHRQDDAVHRHHCSQGRRRADHRGSRLGRRCVGPGAAGPDR
jgi:predicted ester cyclase